MEGGVVVVALVGDEHVDFAVLQQRPQLGIVAVDYFEMVGRVVAVERVDDVQQVMQVVVTPAANSKLGGGKCSWEKASMSFFKTSSSPTIFLQGP